MAGDRFNKGGNVAVNETDSAKRMDEGFPNRLQTMREKRGISRRILSECCGLSKNSIGRYERGEKEPKASALKSIADFFGVSMDDMWGK